MLKRKTPLKAKSPMTRKPIAKRVKKEKWGKKEDCRWRSEQYLAFVRSLPCCVCGATEGVAAHHITGMYQLSGMGLKPADSYTMPACDPIYKHSRDCHQQIHANKALRDQQPKFLRTTLRDGLKQFTGETAEALLHALAFLEAQEQ